MLSINTNLSSLIAQSSMKQSTNKLNQAIERMTTGFKINHASDNAANYSISTNMTTKIGAYNVAEDNAAMGLDMISTAEGTLNQIQDKLERLRALAEQASNGTYGEQSLNAINAEANALVDEIERLYNTAEYNGLKLFGGSTTVTADTASVASIDNSIQTFSLARSVTMPESESIGFIEQVNIQDTSTMNALSEQSFDSDLKDGTYSITTVGELIQLSEMTAAGYISENDIFVLGNNVDLTDSGFARIGDDFKGVFDGNGYKIILPSNTSLFQSISNTVKNLALEGSTVCSGVLGYEVEAGAIVQNVTVKNTASTSGEVDHYASGLVFINSGLIKDCFSNVVFSDNTSQEYWINSALVCYNYGSIATSYFMAEGDVTLMVAWNDGDIDSCYGIFNDVSNPIIADRGSGSLTNSYIASAGGDVLDSSSDWDGSKFTYNLLLPTYTPSSDSSSEDSNIPNSGNESDSSTIPATSKDPSFNTIVLQIGVSSNWASQVGVSTVFELGRVEDLRNIGLDFATDYLSKIDEILNQVSEKQTHFGAVSNRLESVLEEITIKRDNLISSRSTIRDADIAEVSARYIQQQILQEASATLLATANQSPSIALQLI